MIKIILHDDGRVETSRRGEAITIIKQLKGLETIVMQLNQQTRDEIVEKAMKEFGDTRENAEEYVNATCDLICNCFQTVMYNEKGVREQNDKE